MPNSKVNEKNIFLPGGGSQSPFVRPPQINQTGSVPGSMNQAVAQADPATVLGSSAAKPPQNYFQGSGDTFQLTDYAKGAVASLQPATSPATPYTPSETDPTASVYNYMLQPSEEEKRLAKNNESKKRLLLLGDALRHLGNLYYTTKGATPQQFNSPVMTQEQIYQQKRAELQAQRAAAFKNSFEQAKLDADNRNKAFQQQMAVANYQRNLSNDEWNRQFNATKFAHQQKKDEQDYGLNLRKFDETKKHNRAIEGLRAREVSTGERNSNISAVKAAADLRKTDMKDMMAVKHFQDDKSAYISRKWVNSPEGYAVISQLYNKLKNRYTRDSNGRKQDVVDKIYQTGGSTYTEKIEKINPSAMDMLKALQRASFTADYMDFISQYGYDPNEVSYHRKPGYKYTKVAKGSVPQKPQQQKSIAEANKPENKYKKYERNY